ncbi:MAG: hypothetical protein AAFW47_04585 [Pseudomonadota bacterium]
MPLQNRITPFGEILATPERGLLMGNRGGRFHDPGSRTLTRRRWANKAWIICVTSFKNRHREVMGHSYTELFFLDEVTALAAGHRPCFECQRQKAKAYQAAWQEAFHLAEAPKVAIMDPQLHAERLSQRDKRLHQIAKSHLIDGVMVAHHGRAFAVKGDALHAWQFDGYHRSALSLRDLPERVSMITPPSTRAILAEGYQPFWHPTIECA